MDDFGNDADGLTAVRIDRWLWAVRICKTRALATDLCGRGRVLIDGQLAKPARLVRPGQMVGLKKDGVLWQYRVLRCVNLRVGPPVATRCREDCTPAEEVARFRMIQDQWVPSRPQGMGRPTKKDRRDFEKFMNS